MNFRIVNQTIIQSSKKKIFFSFNSKRNFNKNCNFKSRITFYNANKYTSIHILSKKSFNAFTPSAFNLQKRTISNEAPSSNEINKISVPSTQDVSLEEESAKIISSNLPDFIKDVSGWKIVELAQQTLLKVHEVSGLPWWASIAITAFVARAAITLPFSIIMMHNNAKLQMINLEMNGIVEKLKKEANYACSYHGWPENLARQHYMKAVKREYNKLIVRDNCHPAKSFIYLLIQLPMWFSFTFATRNLAYMLPTPDFNAKITYLELMVGGFGWIKNLTDIDHYFILPVLVALINLMTMEVNRVFKTTPPSKFEKWRIYIFRSICLVMIPIASCVPSALNVYWLSSCSFAFGQVFLLNSPRLKRVFKIPLTKGDLEHPYQHFYNHVKSKLTLRKTE